MDRRARSRIANETARKTAQAVMNYAHERDILNERGHKSYDYHVVAMTAEIEPIIELVLSTISFIQGAGNDD